MIETPRSDRILTTLALALLGIGCLLVLRPFLSAVVWAAILASTSWPAFLWMDRLVGARRTLAASLMTLLVTVVLLGPVVAVTVGLAACGGSDETETVTQEVTQIQEDQQDQQDDQQDDEQDQQDDQQDQQDDEQDDGDN